jgi:hypothetical protein
MGNEMNHEKMDALLKEHGERKETNKSLRESITANENRMFVIRELLKPVTQAHFTQKERKAIDSVLQKHKNSMLTEKEISLINLEIFQL